MILLVSLHTLRTSVISLSFGKNLRVTTRMTQKYELLFKRLSKYTEIDGHTDSIRTYRQQTADTTATRIIISVPLTCL